MTDKEELLRLQNKARTAGRICNFYFNTEGHIDGVFYKDRIYDPLTFAEKEREEFAFNDSRSFDRATAKFCRQIGAVVPKPVRERLGF